ncbi:MAG: hypothetical protein NG737_05865 [Omnitrophica bacterium]|nr:hypothetical protein [Candidatus Omnitrophota bacterium]
MKKFLGLVLLVFFLAGCVTTLSSLQRRSIEARDLQGKFDDTFKATLQVFQDYGYIIKNSDYQSGIIQGETGIKRNLLGTMTNFEITATIEQFGNNIVKERITLVKKIKSNSKYGVYEDSKIVNDPELFQKLYDDIQKEIFIRKNLNK